MSKDIRSYFQLKKPSKPVVIEDSDDVIPESPDVQIKNKKKEARKKRRLSDSDDEIFTKKKKPSEPLKSTKKPPEQPKLKEVKVKDLFGDGPIKRTEPLVKKAKKHTETGIHSDEEFEKSLLEVDAEGSTSSITKTEKSRNINHETKSKTDVSNNKSLIKMNVDHKSKEKKEHKHEKHLQHKDTENKDKIHKDKYKESKREHKEDNRHIDLKTNNTSKDHKGSTPSDKSLIDGNSKTKGSKTDHKHIEESHKDRSKATANAFGNQKEKKMDTDSKEKTQKTPEKKENGKPSMDKKRDFSVFLESTDSKEKPQKTPEKKENGKPSIDKKRDFSVFLESDTSILEDHDTPRSKKKKMNNSLNESVLTDEERHERRMQSAALYKQYLNRSGPKHLGAKEIPEGTPDCLANCAFLLTGVLDSFDREQITAAIVQYGGSVKSGISKKVTHVLAGEDSGPAKMAKAQELGIKIIGEDEFLQMIIDNSKKPEVQSDSKVETKKEKTPKRPDKKSPKDSKSNDSIKIKEEKTKDIIKVEKNRAKSKSPHKGEMRLKNQSNHEKKLASDTKLEEKSKSSISIKPETSTVKKEAVSESSTATSTNAVNSMMWVEKYKPQNVKQIIGQHGDASNVKKLINWLTKWYVNRKAKLPKPSPWAKNDDGGFYKAALLSGPPGVGKTTTVALVCKELGFDVVEFNASDTRNKTLIKEQIGELLTTTSLSAYAKGATGKQAVTKKHVLVMDEVDGMTGNEDRGGLQELISLIKNTSVPIICMCNDRNSQKMRSFVNYCYDLRFNRPRVEQIKSAMMSICCKEGIKIPPEALTQLIVAANQDVRQTLNFLSMWSVDSNLSDTERLKKDARSAKKDFKLGPFEACRKVFSEQDHKTMSINDKSDLFFYDYSLSPLFVQENYLQAMPHCPKHEVLERLSKAADSISLGDLVDARIRRQQAWNLLPVQAMYSSVIPGHHMSGHVAGQIQFPGWLGKNSRATKMNRLCQEIHAHTRLSTSGSKSSIFLDYCTHIRDAIVMPLVKEKADGIHKSLEVLESYHLLREDLDSLTEMSLWPGQRDPMVLVDSKIKAAMTRTYNKKALALPYAPGSIKRGRANNGEDGEEDDNEEIEEDSDSDPEKDALIKKKKVKEEKASTSKERPSSSKSGSSKDKPSTSRKKK